MRAPDFGAELWLTALFVLLRVRAPLGRFFCLCSGGRWGCHGVFSGDDLVSFQVVFRDWIVDWSTVDCIL